MNQKISLPKPENDLRRHQINRGVNKIWQFVSSELNLTPAKHNPKSSLLFFMRFTGYFTYLTCRSSRKFGRSLNKLEKHVPCLVGSDLNDKVIGSIASAIGRDSRYGTESRQKVDAILYVLKKLPVADVAAGIWHWSKIYVRFQH